MGKKTYEVNLLPVLLNRQESKQKLWSSSTPSQTLAHKLWQIWEKAPVTYSIQYLETTRHHYGVSSSSTGALKNERTYFTGLYDNKEVTQAVCSIAGIQWYSYY